VWIDRLWPLPVLAFVLVVGTGQMIRAAPAADQALVAKGQYLVRAGDCIACHTNPGGALFAGGRPMATPFGTLYTSNITPDPTTGIGSWTADDFYRTMHTGRFPDGGLIYPAMPFGSYTKVTRGDSDAIFAYLRSVAPVRQANRPHDLRFPFNNRQLILGWRTLFFQEGEYQPDPTKSAEWNRGAYLVEGLGHCSMCHSPINALGGSSESAAFEGGLIPMQNWYAPSLTSNKEAGLGEWSIEEIVDLLRNGISHRGAVYGPMAEVTFNSLQYLSDADVRAMAIYLKSLGQGSPPGTEVSGLPAPEGQLAAKLRPDRLRHALRELPCAGRPRHAARLSAIGGQSVDPDGIRGEPGPHGPQRRVPARHGRQPDALRDAALRAEPFRRRGRSRCHLYPRRLGQPGVGGLLAPGQRAAHGAFGLMQR
jgi:mono/diheme cytochrome c family protein